MPAVSMHNALPKRASPCAVPEAKLDEAGRNLDKPEAKMDEVGRNLDNLNRALLLTIERMERLEAALNKRTIEALSAVLPAAPAAAEPAAEAPAAVEVA